MRGCTPSATTVGRSRFTTPVWSASSAPARAAKTSPKATMTAGRRMERREGRTGGREWSTDLCATPLCSERGKRYRRSAEGGPMARIALVTGTSSGIGLGTAVALARAGFTVVATMRNLRQAVSLQARAKRDGVPLDVRQLDLQDEHAVDDRARGAQHGHGGVHVLVTKTGAG